MKQLLYVMIVLPSVLAAQVPPALTLEQANAQAAGNFPLIQQRQLIKQTTGITITNLQKGYLPQLNFSAQATYQSDVTKVPVKIPGMDIPTLSKDQYKAVAEVNQLLYDGGSIRRQQEIQELNALVQDEQVSVQLQQLRQRINDIYFGILLTDQQLIQNKLVQQDIQAGINKVQAQVQYGTALRSNLAVLQAEFLRNEQRTIELQATRTSLLQVLGLFMNQALDTATTLITPTPTVDVATSDLAARSEMQLYEYQDSLLALQAKLATVKNQPKITAFVQGGYGKPGLNMLNNEFAWFYITGLRFNWSLSNLYTAGKEQELYTISRRSNRVQQQNFVLMTHAILAQQRADIHKMKALMATDEQIIALRTTVKNSAAAQLANGVLTANDYIREVDAADQAQQAYLLHRLQWLQAIVNYNTSLGKP